MVALRGLTCGTRSIGKSVADADVDADAYDWYMQVSSADAAGAVNALDEDYYQGHFFKQLDSGLTVAAPISSTYSHEYSTMLPYPADRPHGMAV